MANGFENLNWRLDLDGAGRDDDGGLTFGSGVPSTSPVRTSGSPLTFGGAIDSAASGIGGIIEGIGYTLADFGGGGGGASGAPRPVPRPSGGGSPGEIPERTPANVDGGAGWLDMPKAGTGAVLENIGALGDFGGGSGDGANRGNTNAAQRVSYGNNAAQGIGLANILLLAGGAAAVYWVASR